MFVVIEMMYNMTLRIYGPFRSEKAAQEWAASQNAKETPNVRFSVQGLLNPKGEKHAKEA